MTYQPDMNLIEQDNWRWSGDKNVEEGGFYWRPISDDLVEAVGVVPHPSNPSADYDDEIFLIQWHGEIFLRPDNQASVLETCGYRAIEGGIADEAGGVMAGEDAYTVLVESAHAYGGIEGATDEAISRAELAKIGMSLAEYVNRVVGIEPETESPAP